MTLRDPSRASTRPPEEGATADLLDQLATLSREDERESFFQQYPHLIAPDIAKALCGEAIALLARDLSASRRLCGTLGHLAQRSDDSLVKGYSDKAHAALLHLAAANYEGAVRFWRSARERFQAADDPEEVAITSYCALSTLALVGEDQLFSEWERYARTHFEQTGDHLRLARLDTNVGTWLARQDRWSEALSSFEAAYEELLLETDEPNDLQAALVNLAACYEGLGDHPKALSLLGKARDLSYLHGLRTKEASIQANIANLNFAMGNFPAALTLYREAGELAGELGDAYIANHSLQGEGEVLIALGLAAEAEPILEAALSGYRRLALSFEQANVLSLLGVVSQLRGNLPLARRRLTQARISYAKLQNLPKALGVDLELARGFLEEGRVYPAERIASRVLSESQSILPLTTTLNARLVLAEAALTSASPNRALDHSGVVIREVGLLEQSLLEARAHEIQGRAREQLGELKAASRAFRRSQGCLERVMRHLGPGELRSSFMSDKSGISEALLHLLFLQQRTERATGAPELGTWRRQSARSEDPSEASSAELRELRMRLRACESELKQLQDTAEPKPTNRLAHLRRTSEDLERQILVKRREIELLSSPTLSRSFPRERREEVRDEHEPRDGVSLVDFRTVRGGIVAIVSSQSGTRIVRLDRPVAGIRKVQRLLEFSLRRQEPVHPTALAATSVYLRQLGEALLEPLTDQLKTEEIAVVPRSFFDRIPFHALTVHGEPAADRFRTSFSFTGPQRAQPPSTSRTDSRIRLLVIGCGDSRSHEVAAETASIHRLFPQSIVLRDEEATISNFVELAPSADIVHIAAHGVFRSDSPWFTSVALADGHLSAEELSGLSLRARLVVLSSCMTAVSAPTPSTHRVGLPRALAEAGARTTIASLWSVADHVAAEFMGLLYRSLSEGSTAGRALHTTMQTMRTHWEHPRHWAPFVLIGDSSVQPVAPTVQLSSR